MFYLSKKLPPKIYKSIYLIYNEPKGVLCHLTAQCDSDSWCCLRPSSGRPHELLTEKRAGSHEPSFHCLLFAVRELLLCFSSA